ncbi:hypothetical protein ABZT03_10500 [Streptomyces sp. NPDC005574]
MSALPLVPKRTGGSETFSASSLRNGELAFIAGQVRPAGVIPARKVEG